MSAVREITLDIKIICADVHSSLVLVPSWYDPSLNCSIIASCANLWFPRTSTASKDNRSNSIQVASQSESDLETSSVCFLRRVQRQLVLTASAP
jgi:hypothetical protein